MTTTVTDRLLHHLVAGSHAEGTTRLAVAAAIEHDDRTLLIATDADDFDPLWQLPADLVLPGETLLNGLCRTVSVTTGLDVIDITGYVGHHDRLVEGDIVRTFVFTITTTDPDRVCRWTGHHWSPEPINPSNIAEHLETYPLTTPAAAGPIGLTPTQHLSAALQANAKGLLCVEAAVEILINQRSWLQRGDFTDRFVEPVTNDHQLTSYPDGAFVDWTAALAALGAGRLPCSSGEAQLLRIAASLAEGIPIDLRDAITGLDHINTGIVAHAIRHAAGHQS